MYFVINGETPSKKNSRIINTKTGRSFPSKKYADWHKTAVLELRAQIKDRLPPINKPVQIDLRFIHGDKRRRDSDNGASSILDTLTDSGVLFDDNWEIVKKLTIENDYEKNAARCLITITEI